MQKALAAAGTAFAEQSFQKAFDLWSSALPHVDSSMRDGLNGNRAAALQNLGKNAEALSVLEEALAAAPEDCTLLLYNKAVVLQNLKREAEALAAVAEALAAPKLDQATRLSALRLRNKLLVGLEDFGAAEAAAAEAAAALPGSGQLAADLAFVLLKQSRNQEAVAQYEAARELGDASAETSSLYGSALAARAVELDKEGDYAAAEAMYSAALAQESTERRLFNRGFLHMRLGGSSGATKAIKDFRAALKLNPKQASACAALGTLLLQASEWAEAAAVLTTAAQQSPDNTDVLYNLGLAKHKLERNSEAVQHFKAVLALQDSHENALKGLDVAQAAMAAAGIASANAHRGGGAAASVPQPAPKVAPAPVAAAPAPAPVKAAATRSASPSSWFTAAGRSAEELDSWQGLQLPLEQLTKAPFYEAEGFEKGSREAYLSAADFQAALGMSKPDFYKMPKWKRDAAKKKVGLF